MADAFLELGQIAEALKTLQRAIEQHPTASSPYLALGLIKRKAKDSPAALAAFEAAAAVAPNNARAHLEVANELRALGQDRRADALVEN